MNTWRNQDRLDVVVMVEVCNGDLEFAREEGGLVARLRIEVGLAGYDGAAVSDTRQVRTPPLNPADAASRTQFQVFGLILEDVPFRAGRLTCGVFDVNRRRVGLLNQLSKNPARSECAADWYAEDGPRAPRGLALEDPLFLARAPLGIWNPDHVQQEAASTDWLQDYAHPSRRYGLQEERLQIFLPVWPPATGAAAHEDLAGLRVQITGLDMPIVLNDTIAVDERGRSALSAGRSAGLFYELDVNLLPEGSYRLSLAPLGGQGRGLLRDFTVVWRLDALGRHRHQVLGEGRTVFTGAQLETFLASSPLEQEARLDEFWDALNPDPESPVNPAYLEFQYRLAYVREFLGGFGEFGPHDARGEVFLLLGPPDEMQGERMPMNDRDQDDARIKVYQRFAPDRDGTWAKGDPIGGTQTPGSLRLGGRAADAVLPTGGPLPRGAPFQRLAHQPLRAVEVRQRR